MPDTRHRIVFVHGMGSEEPLESYALLEQGLRDAWQGEGAISDRHRFAPVQWWQRTHDPKLELFRRAFAAEPVPFGIESAEHPVLAARTFMTFFLGDVVAYTTEHNNGIREAFWADVRKALPDEDLDAGATFSFVAHSLGSVIAYDFLWHLFFGQNGDGDLFDPVKNDPAIVAKLRKAVRGFYSMGSPIGLFLLRRGELWESRVEHPIFADLQNPMQDRTWVNFYDRDDIVAYPLGRIFVTPAAAVRRAPRDVEVQTGNVFTAHVGYWKSRQVATEIAAMLLG